jgi:hypothetical protein
MKRNNSEVSPVVASSAGTWQSRGLDMKTEYGNYPEIKMFSDMGCFTALRNDDRLSFGILVSIFSGFKPYRIFLELLKKKN